MKIIFENSINKHYIEIIPTFAFSWFDEKMFYIGWLFWGIAIYI